MESQNIEIRGGHAPSADSEIALRSVLLPGEKIMHLAAISFGIYWKGVVMLAVGIVTLLLSLTLGVYLTAVAGAILIVEYLTQKYLLLAVTDRRVVMRYGIIDLQTVDLPFTRVESVEVITPPMGRLLGYAGVVVTGTGGLGVLIPFVSDAAEFRADIARLLETRTPPPLAEQPVQNAA